MGTEPHEPRLHGFLLQPPAIQEQVQLLSLTQMHRGRLIPPELPRRSLLHLKNITPALLYELVANRQILLDERHRGDHVQTPGQEQDAGQPPHGKDPARLTRGQAPLTMCQDDACRGGNIEPTRIQAADGVRQREIEEQDGVQREQDPNQGKAPTKVFSRKLVANEKNTEQRGHQPGADVARTLEIKDEERRENAAKEELKQEIGSLPSDSGKASFHTLACWRRGQFPDLTVCQPERQQPSPQQKGAETPEVDHPDPLTDGQGIPGKSTEKCRQGVTASENVQGIAAWRRVFRQGCKPFAEKGQLKASVRSRPRQVYTPACEPMVLWKSGTA